MTGIVLSVAPQVYPPASPPPAVVTYAAPEPASELRANTVVTCDLGSKHVVTNVCKASLDDVALFLMNYPKSHVAVKGGLENSINVHRYFVDSESKLGIEPARVGINIVDNMGGIVEVTEYP